MISIFIWLSLLLITSPRQNIMDYGAVANEDSLRAQQANQKAIMQAIAKANSSESIGDQRVILIPNSKFYSLPFFISQASDIVLEIRGKLSACNRIKHWPKSSNKISYQDFIGIAFSKNITITGGGKIDGRGYIWWLNSWLVTKKYMPPHAGRPHLIVASFVENLLIHDLTLKNSPSFHIATSQVINATIYNIDIKVNTTAQLDILKRNYLTGIVPLFPLNTDGIDPSGKNFHIFNISCQNYDDVVVPKPSHAFSGSMTNCTENMLIQNVTVRLGVGLSVGSVPPNEGINCVRNITFRNAYFKKPFKGIYIKTNPGDKGYGLIDNILYENITMHEPIWWAIYLGPQQQKQPDRGGPGCMFYPFDPKGTCETQPRINITNIKLKNVMIRNSLLFPIVMRCNQTNPCLNITFQNVRADKWTIGNRHKGYVCENVKGEQINSIPKLDCLSQSFSSNLQDNIGAQQALDYQYILHKLEQASIELPYQDEDDEMFLSPSQIVIESAFFLSSLISQQN